MIDLRIGSSGFRSTENPAAGSKIASRALRYRETLSKPAVIERAGSKDSLKSAAANYPNREA